MPASNKDRLSIDVESGAILAALARATALVDAPQAMLFDIGQQLEANIRLRFTSKTDPAGQKWQPLAESTRAAYQKKFKGTVPGSLLMRSGLMLNTLASNVSGNALEVGFSAPYAIFHITGTSRMPRRDSLFASIAASASSGAAG